MQRMIRGWGVVALCVGAISACHGDHQRGRADRTATRGHGPTMASGPGSGLTRERVSRWGKPSAPVDVRLDTRAVGGGAYDVTLIATPRRDVGALELDLDGRTLVVGPTRAGEPRTMTTRVVLDADGGREIAGSAGMEVGRHRRRAAASARLGAAAKPAPRYRIVRLPDGSEAAEVRP